MMRTYEQWRNYRELELIRRHPPVKNLLELQILSLLQGLGHFWQDLWCSNNEPQISEITDSTGQTRWKIYQPTRDRTFQLESQQEVLTWLEQRHQ
ncbi:hypothetical protein H6G17_15010 [Chroococcidiopsis sp. FACHB-1243]|uniref:hypothetical protein n=1 Tax=Chroococcidiopsis sp. [FACHB-1243] TaxID=2692781 RepID=UPI00177F6BC6|nr:hypothetical protein [Chroococcidiopsis sp. [FACHB-1243]]MBD2306813.1 hypothetical protein [Chroococcidiopsis sp. [FACHB-1243]]